MEAVTCNAGLKQIPVEKVFLV